MINIRQLNFSYPNSNFDLHVPELKIDSPCSAAIVGPSGSGKTTLLHLVAGILSPNSGDIVVNDQPISSLSDTARRRFRLQHIGMVFQSFELIEYLSVLDNVLLPCRIGDALALTSEIRDRATSLLTAVGLEQHTGKSVTRLSQGERQRVAICRALLTQPSLLLADEPTGNLDPRFVRSDSGTAAEHRQRSQLNTGDGHARSFAAAPLRPHHRLRTIPETIRECDVMPLRLMSRFTLPLGASDAIASGEGCALERVQKLWSRALGWPGLERGTSETPGLPSQALSSPGHPGIVSGSLPNRTRNPPLAALDPPTGRVKLQQGALYD